MRTYTIVKKPLNLDWSKIPKALVNIQLQEHPVDISATAQLCYDKESLFVRLESKEKFIRAVENGPLGAPCEDSCLEFFFCPIEGDNRYFNIEYNPNGCIYWGIASNIKDLIRLIPESETPFSPKIEIDSEGWNITYEIPYEVIRRFFPNFNPVSGKKMYGNFYKCGDLTVQEHYLCWNQITANPVSFHRTCDFGLLEFE